jgi:type VI secretion system protein VasD
MSGRLAMGSGLLILLAGCATSGAAAPAAAERRSCRVPNDVQLEIEAADRVNPDETGRSLPTRLRLYQLSDLNRLQRASFEDVWARPKEALGETALSSEEIVVYPGQVMVHRFKRDDQAAYLVGVAIFREPEGEAWRTAQEWPLPGDPCQRPGAAPIAKLDKLRLRMFLDGNRIDSVNNYAQLPKRQCRECGANPKSESDLRRNRRLRSFEEDPREPELRSSPP